MNVLETERLVLRRLRTNDAPFIHKLVNEPSWLEYIGDKGVRTLQDAQRYIRDGPIEMYGRLGFGLYLVQLRNGGEPAGICGLIKREALEDVDLGFAFLPAFRSNGYAFESAAAVMSYARRVLKLTRIVAITTQDNLASVRLLARLGFHREGVVRIRADGEDLELYAA